MEFVKIMLSANAGALYYSANLTGEELDWLVKNDELLELLRVYAYPDIYVARRGDSQMKAFESKVRKYNLEKRDKGNRTKALEVSFRATKDNLNFKVKEQSKDLPDGFNWNSGYTFAGKRIYINREAYVDIYVNTSLIQFYVRGHRPANRDIHNLTETSKGAVNNDLKGMAAALRKAVRKFNEEWIVKGNTMFETVETNDVEGRSIYVQVIK
jgi:hypothetical protein